MIKTYRDLLIWQKSMDLMTDIYCMTGLFPDNEKFGLTSQLRRSSVSIPSNIAEGYGRNTNPEFRRFLNIAMGSLFELQTQVEASYRLEIIDQEVFKNIYSKTREIERMMSSLISKL